LADGFSQACHMCTLLIFPVPAVGLLASFQLLAGGLHRHAGPIWIFPDVPRLRYCVLQATQLVAFLIPQHNFCHIQDGYCIHSVPCVVYLLVV